MYSIIKINPNYFSTEVYKALNLQEKEINESTNAGKGLLDIQPQLKSYKVNSPEPSLRELVYKYYEKNFSHENALELRKEYFERLFQQQREEN